MKLFLALSLLVSATASAQVLTKSTYYCNYWSYKDGVYVCGSYPMQEQVVDAYSLNSKIRELEQRIAALEKKLGN
ncbi:MAG: hypothetical protein ABL930_05965 [Pseudobdellovibrio sp.]